MIGKTGISFFSLDVFAFEEREQRIWGLGIVVQEMEEYRGDWEDRLLVASRIEQPSTKDLLDLQCR